jgi:hypothetical protein
MNRLLIASLLVLTGCDDGERIGVDDIPVMEKHRKACTEYGGVHKQYISDRNAPNDVDSTVTTYCRQGAVFIIRTEWREDNDNEL